MKIRLNKKVIVKTLLVIFMTIYSIHWISVFLSGQLRGRVDNVRSHEQVDKVLKVLIYTRGRSGSSFLGSLFDASPDVLYFYEPLAKVTQTVQNVAELDRQVSRELRKLFNCDLSLDWIYYFISKETRHRLSLPGSGAFFKQLYRDVQSNQWTLEQIQERVNSHCQSQTHIVVKCIERLRSLQLVEEIWDESFYVLFLVRDPRAVVMSRTGLQFKGVQARTSAEARALDEQLNFLCGSTLKDVQFLKEKGHLIQSNTAFLRYEDMALDAFQMADILFNFVHLPIHPDVTAWLNSTYTKQNEANPYSLKRDPDLAMNKWRTTINALTLETIQNNPHCRSYMQLFGYIPVEFSQIANKQVSIRHESNLGSNYVKKTRDTILGL